MHAWLYAMIDGREDKQMDELVNVWMARTLVRAHVSSSYVDLCSSMTIWVSQCVACQWYCAHQEIMSLCTVRYMNERCLPVNLYQHVYVKPICLNPCELTSLAPIQWIPIRPSLNACRSMHRDSVHVHSTCVHVCECVCVRLCLSCKHVYSFF